MKRLYILIALAVALAIANASVFVYYTGTINISTVPPPIIFAQGSNAGQPDLGAENTIGVTISNANTTLSITVHPTYQINYYKNLTLIKNLDNKAYYVFIKVAPPTSRGALTSAYLIIRDSSGNLVNTVNLLTSDITYVGSLGGSSQWTVDLQFVFSTSGGSYNTAPSAPGSITIQLIYTPEQVTQTTAVPTPIS